MTTDAMWVMAHLYFLIKYTIMNNSKAIDLVFHFQGRRPIIYGVVYTSALWVFSN